MPDLEKLEKIVARIQELTSLAEQSAANHNALVGSLHEAKNLYQMLMTQADTGNSTNDIVDGQIEE